MRRLLLVLALCLFLAPSAQARGWRLVHRSTETTSASEAAPVDTSPVYPVEHALLKRINEIRLEFGLRALIFDFELHRSARRHCGWMARSSSMVHSSGPFAENIAMGQVDVDEVVSAWMSSPGHRANILNPNYAVTGVSAYYNTETGTPFWCQQFN